MSAIYSEAAGHALIAVAPEVGAAAEHALKDALEATADNAKASALFQDRTGQTRQSILWTQSGTAGEVSAGGASTWLEFGTQPHDITPKNGPFLHFVMNGHDVFARKVHHPGTAERPFMQQAADHGEQVLDYGIDHYVSDALK